jgi:hypothetical protein
VTGRTLAPAVRETTMRAMTTLTTRLRIAAWDEVPLAEYEDGSKITRATVSLADGPDGLESGTIESLMYYRPDGTSHYVNVMRLTATLEGRSGTITLSGTGTFDGTTASGRSTVLPDSATGELAGMSGSVSSSSTHADYPFMPITLEYDSG